MISTRGFLTVLECTYSFSAGAPSRAPRGGSLQRLPDSLADLTGPTTKEEGEEGRRERGRKGRGAEETRVTAPFHKFLDPPLIICF